jgi:hypothetical protein
MGKAVEPGPHATLPPFFQATIAKSSQSKLHLHRHLLKPIGAAMESVFNDHRNKKDVCIR